jgi:hypothetical protein
VTTTTGLTVREQQEIALDQRVSRIDAQARDDGHSPGEWAQLEDDGDLVASCRCRTCGADAAVRVRPDGAWQAGRLRLTRCPSPREVSS